MDCLFCKFVAKEITPEIVFENHDVLGFKDIAPMAKVHILFIPKKHSCDVSDMSNKGHDIASVFSAINSYVNQEKLDTDGYRVVTNKGPVAGQSVFHTHFHLLAGETLKGFGA
jgi:histidine triad (HIT) family protein